MSIKSILKTLLLFLTAGISYFFLTNRVYGNKQTLTNTHLNTIEKINSLNKNHSKMGTPLFIEVSSVNNSNQFIGKINLQRFDIEQIYYSWTLPDGSTIESGELSGAISINNNNGVFALPIQVSGLDHSANQNIILSAWIVSNGQNIGASGNVATHPEETFEHQATQIIESRNIASAHSKLNKLSNENTTDQKPIRKIHF